MRKSCTRPAVKTGAPRKKHSALLFLVILLSVPLTVTAAEESDVTRFVDEEFGCSFEADKKLWQKSSKIRFSMVKYGFVEFVNRKNLSHFIFYAEVTREPVEQTMQTILGSIRSHSRRIKRVRHLDEYRLAGMAGVRREIVFLSKDRITYSSIIIILNRGPVRYTFVFFAMELFAAESVPGFEKILDSFAAEEIENPEELINRHSALVFTDENFFKLLNRLVKNPNTYQKRSVIIRGFVYREGNFPDNRFLLGRNYTPPGGQEALPYGLLCQHSRAASLKQGQWYEARGTLATTKNGEKILPLLIIKKLDRAKAPERQEQAASDDESREN